MVRLTWLFRRHLGAGRRARARHLVGRERVRAGVVWDADAEALRAESAAAAASGLSPLRFGTWTWLVGLRDRDRRPATPVRTLAPAGGSWARTLPCWPWLVDELHLVVQAARS